MNHMYNTILFSDYRIVCHLIWIRLQIIGSVYTAQYEIRNLFANLSSYAVILLRLKNQTFGKSWQTTLSKQYLVEANTKKPLQQGLLLIRNQYLVEANRVKIKIW